MVVVKPNRRHKELWSTLSGVALTLGRGTVGRIVFFLVILTYAFSLISMHETVKSNVHPEHAPPKKDDVVTVAIAPQEVERALQVMQEEKKKEILKQRATPKPKPPIEFVDTSTWAKPSTDYVVHPTDLWESAESSKVLPQWMIQYFRWHKEQTTIHSWKSDSWKLANKYMFVTCLADYIKCGGTADRLLGLPFFLKVAASTQRVLLIQWTKPAPLEEYLLPPAHGIDWRVQRGMDEVLLREGVKVGTQDTILQYAVWSNATVLQTKFQSHDHGSIYYDSHRESLDEADFDTVFATVWRICFTPAPAVAAEIQRTMERDNLLPGQYTSAHLRALYQTNVRDTALIQAWTVNALRCAIQLQHRKSSASSALPVYFASDSDKAVRQAIYFSKKHSVLVVSQPEYDHSENALHIDKTKDWKDRPPRDFFGIFIDLYVLSLGQCVTYGLGGFGKLASLMSTNATCSIVHMTATSSAQCVVPDSVLRRRHSGVESEAAPRDHVEYSEDSSMFLPPMHGHNNMNERRVIVHPNEHLNDPVATEPPKRRIIIAHQEEPAATTDPRVQPIGRRIIVVQQDPALESNEAVEADPPKRRIIVAQNQESDQAATA